MNRSLSSAFILVFGLSLLKPVSAHAVTPVKKESKSVATVASPTPTAAAAAAPEQNEAMAEALSKGDFAKAKQLHKAGVSYDVFGSDELTGLMRLADDGDEASIKTALSLGANINAKNSNNENALWYAVYSGHEKVALELLKKGASPAEIRPDTKECLMHMTAQSGLATMSAKLVKLTPKCLTQKDTEGRTPSEVAKSLGYKKIAKLLAVKK